VNETQDILDSFQPYYELTSIKENSEPNHLYDLKSKIESANVIWESEVNNFCSVFFKSSKTLSASDQGKLNAYIDPAVERFKALPKESSDLLGAINQDDFKHALVSFTRTYSFLTQIMPFSDADLEKYFTYGKFLLKKLPRTSQSQRFALNDEVSLEYYRLQKISENTISLESKGVSELDGGGEGGIRLDKDEKAKLSEIIDILNTKFNTEFHTADKLFFDQIEEELVVNTGLKEQAQNNSMENFKFGFEELFVDMMIGRMEQNQELFTKVMDDKEFGDVVKGYMLKKVYERLVGRL
jgi:type I restriction enzyme R subunit